MTDLNAAWVQVRAHAVVLREHGRRVRESAHQHRHVLVSAVLIVAGLAGGLGFASLVGTWCLGLVGMAESAGVLWFGLMRDDGRPVPRRGARTVREILEDERLRPDPDRPLPGPRAWNM